MSAITSHSYARSSANAVAGSTCKGTKPARREHRPTPLKLRVLGCLSGAPVGPDSLYADRAWTVREVKAELERREGTPLEGQAFLYEGRVLDNSEVVGDIVPSSVQEASLCFMRLDPARTEALRSIRSGQVELEDLGDDLRNDREIVLAAVHVDGFALQYASEALRQDPTVVQAAVQADGQALVHAPDTFREDPTIVLSAVAENGMVLQHAGENARKNREVVRAAVQSRCEALQYAAPSLRGDQELVLDMLRHAREHPKALYFASTSLLDDRDFMLNAVQICPFSIRYASDRLSKDRDIIRAAVQGHTDTFLYADNELKEDRAFVLELARTNGCCITHAAPAVREDPVVLATAMRNNPNSIAWLRRMRSDMRNQLMQAVRKALAALDAEAAG